MPKPTIKRVLPALLALLAFIPSAAHASGDKELGEYLSSQCTTCHQLSGKDNGIPAIIGWDTESFVAVMQSYKNRERDNQVMQNIANTLSDADMAALAAYFATLKPVE